MPQDALQSVLTQAGLAISRLQTINTPERGVAFFRQLGYELPPGAFGGALPALATQATDLASAVGLLAGASGEGGVSAATVNLMSKLVGTVNAIRQLHVQLQAGGGAGLPNFGDFPRRLTDFLILDCCNQLIPDLHATLHVFGLVEHEPSPAPGQSMRLINWDRFARFLTNPAQIANDLYRWDTDFDVAGFLLRLESLMRSAALPGGMYPQSAAAQAALGNPSANLPELRLPIFQQGLTSQTYSQFGITFSPVEAQGAAKKGLALLPYLIGATDFQFDVCDRGELAFQSSVDIKQTGLILRPPVNAQGILGMSVPFRVGLDIHEKPDRAEEIVLIGSPGGSRVSVQGLGVTWFAENIQDKVDLGVKAHIESFRLLIEGGEGDGFIQKILPGLHVQAEAALAFGMSLLSGFTFQAGANLQVQLDTHIGRGPIEINGIRLALAPANDNFGLGVGALLKSGLGPLTAVVEDVGIQSQLQFQLGNFGPANLDVKFKPPTGVGLSLDVGIIKGAGFLSVDTDRGEYAGALDLVFADFLHLNAIGLISTKMPDGSSGFSLLIVITADFGQGIQLGFGFTLLAVGGLLGVNRAMAFQPLMDGIRSNAIESVMFPHDPIANAMRIISDLRTFFPPQEGTFLIGPMGKLGWGEPTLISLSLGIVIEIPPGDIAILGILKLALPAEDVAILVLQVNFAGALEFDKSRFYFFASLFDSHLLFLTLEGEMGVLMAFGADANFVVSVGGFHPQFNPPPLPFPSPGRIELDIINESFARIRCDGYFAVTSNTCQFGSHSDYFFGFSALNLEGHSGFDALLQFSPFHFSVSISTSFSVNVFDVGVYGVGIDLLLEGPTPWHAHGTASLSFFLFSVDIGIDFTWGDSRDTMLPPVQLMPILAGELGKQSNWRAFLPSGSILGVTLRQLDPGEAGMLLHPLGTLQVSQRAIPLDLTLDKEGNQVPSDANRFALTVASAGLAPTRTLQEQFALAQFKNLADAAKLSQAAYSPLDSGIELSATGNLYGSGTAITCNVRYNLTIIDTKLRRFKKRFFVFLGSLFNHFLLGTSAARSSLSAYRQTQVQPFTDKVAVNPETFAVASAATNTIFHPAAASFTSQAAAQDYLARAVASDPSLDGTLHVIPQFEVAA
jgi:hypothetical protein